MGFALPAPRAARRKPRRRRHLLPELTLLSAQSSAAARAVSAISRAARCRTPTTPLAARAARNVPIHRRSNVQDDMGDSQDDVPPLRASRPRDVRSDQLVVLRTVVPVSGSADFARAIAGLDKG